MSRLQFRFEAVALAFCVITLLSAGGLCAEKPTKMITGKVKRAEVYQGEFLVVRSTEVGKQLVKHVGATVKATGYVKKARPDSEFKLVIDVLHYEIVPPDGPSSDATPALAKPTS